MAMVLCESEEALFGAIRANPGYERFAGGYLRHKVRREAQAWQTISASRGAYSVTVMDKVFRKIEEKGGIWFGRLLLGRNRRLILGTPAGRLNTWMENLLFRPGDIWGRFARACREKIPGTDTGLPSLLLYLQKPDDAKILIPTSQRGLEKVRGLPRGDEHEASYYRDFCESVNNLQNTYDFWPEEMDWIFWVIDTFVNTVGSNFKLEQTRLARI
jgi:hypothetical protein